MYQKSLQYVQELKSYRKNFNKLALAAQYKG